MSNHHLPITNNHSSVNANLAWARMFVEELAVCGLTAVIISPGSRSTPLTLAFHAQPGIETFLHLDERSAGFFALGMALAGDRPAALVCTSGTAVANYLPAIVEAQMSQAPLLVLTSDRPHELRHSGANQTIDQVKLFGDQVLWSVDMPVPHNDAPAVALRNVRALAARAYGTANGLRKGPVHINFPFRKPLEPDDPAEWQMGDARDLPRQPAATVTVGQIHPTDAQIRPLQQALTQQARGLIVCGPRCPGGDFPQAVAALSRHTGYPILADPISGVRFGAHVADTAVLSAYETFMQQDPGWENPQVIVRFGVVPTSKWLNAYLDGVRPQARFHIRENGVWADDSQRTTHFIQANETAVCRTLVEEVPPRSRRAWETAVMATEAAAWQALEKALAEPLFDGAIVADVAALIPDGALLFMGNSSPIRHLDQYGRARAKAITAVANRGASGIDGNTSTALGLHAASGQPLVAVLGDITFFHDLNGLLMVKQLSQRQATGPITIVLLNNNGGGIFNRLPIARHDPPFSRLFLTPHGLDFAPVCQMFGLAYAQANGRSHFRELFSAGVSSHQPRLIEVRTDNQQDEAIRREVNRRVLAGQGS